MKNFFKTLLASTIGSIIGFSIAFAIVVFMTIGIISSLVSIPKTGTLLIPQNSVLMLKLDKPIYDRTPDNPLSNFNFNELSSINTPGLDKIIMAIKKAKSDNRIKGIYLELSAIPASISTLSEIKKVLADFKSSGKFIIAYSETYTQKSYYIASVADSIFLNPQGAIDFKGLTAQVGFIKGTLNKLNIEMQIIRHGKYKSAVEPLTLDKMSEANKEQTYTYVLGLWEEILKELSKARNISHEELNKIADELLVQDPQNALKYKLIDKLYYKDQVISTLQKYLSLNENAKVSFVSLEKYVNDLKPFDIKTKTKNKIAVIYAEGEIESGEGDFQTIGSEKLSKTIRKARSDSSIKAIVLRINSPGGSALASEIIWREIILAKKNKPVIVSMGSIAASGGYYIACPANKIFAQPYTLTGSIGVFGVIPNFKKFFSDKLGITFDYVNTNKHSDYISVVRGMDPYEKLVLQNSIERIYETFINHVAESRNMTPTYVDSIGQGRIWNGIDAKKIGLIDEIGGIEDAILEAAKMSGITDYNIIALPEHKDPFTKIIDELTGSLPEEIIKKQLGEAYIWYNYINKTKQLQGVQARLPFEINIY
ncbi:MAG TPA: signal peptide peptidase SppA [Bacteroidales bacterium]|nr:signal peptide peptidase SppA [Bacteroidales bacterium]